MMSHPSYHDRYRNVFSLPVEDRGLSILLQKDRANDYERYIRICEPLQNHNTIDCFTRKKSFRKSEEKPEKARAKKLAIKDQSH